MVWIVGGMVDGVFLMWTLSSVACCGWFEFLCGSVRLVWRVESVRCMDVAACIFSGKE